MSTEWSGSYVNGIWTTSIRVRLLGVDGVDTLMNFDDALLDTGACYFVLPGVCAQPPKKKSELPKSVVVKVVNNETGEDMLVELAARGRVQLSGVGSDFGLRYIFTVGLRGDGLSLVDYVEAIFIEPEIRRQPIIGIQQLIQNDNNIVFSRNGFKLELPSSNDE